MIETSSHLTHKLRTMLKVTTPILITQVAMYLITFFDILMSSRYGSVDLAGVAVGSSIWMPVYTGLSGILVGITPIVAHLNGAKNKQEIKRMVQQGIYVALLLSIVISFLLFLVSPIIISKMPIEEAVSHVSLRYIQSLLIGIVPLFVYSVLRSYMDGLGMTRITMFITLLSAPINVFFNYLFIFGNWGFPELGGIGAGVASAITYWIVLGISMYVIHTKQPFLSYYLFTHWSKIQLKKWKEILSIGVPIGLSIFAETSIFAAVTLLMSTYSTAVISAHQIALNFTSLLYMVPLSISFGATVLIGNELGANNVAGAKTYSRLAVSSAIVFSGLSAAILYFYREPISTIYTSDQEVIPITIQFFLYAALFQLSDAIQAPVQGALRGYKDVNVTFIMAIISYWVIGLPVGYYFANFTNYGPFGYWIGLIAGLTIGAITLSVRLHRIQRKKEKMIS
ncbi:MATE family efflux transporter [Paenisporosarcina cavernae]|uniref:Probable multidrug resistance protein NorM n=1 Tax=Paenisporosarcina cavernae TaxID=2320858 RepID=A0A385YSG4_9BACL|nr:MATE family efflux transporter [Paenisporosarcina cavernae]AYC29454.1 MATE family efflux transporter [Paenisporosarcina cavernae]